MTEIIWQDPPPARRGRQGKYIEFFDVLRDNPGKWAIFQRWERPTSAASPVGTRIRKGELVGSAPAGAFETAIRSTKDESVIYVRYVGEV